MPNTGYEQWRCDGRGDQFALPAREIGLNIVLRFVDDQGVVIARAARSVRARRCQRPFADGANVS